MKYNQNNHWSTFCLFADIENVDVLFTTDRKFMSPMPYTQYMPMSYMQLANAT